MAGQVRPSRDFASSNGSAQRWRLANDWTSAAESGAPRCGHSWPRSGPGGGGFPGGGGGGGDGEFGDLNNWMSALNEAGCAPGVFIVENGPPGMNGTKSVGDGGGYGGIYCFALTP